MELRVLNYFLMVAREENITKAASLLHLTQPTLSRQLMQLEEELGVQLFTRSKHRIVLTDDGMLLRRRAEELVSLAEKTKEELQHQEKVLSGKVTIGSGELQSSQFLAQLIHSFHQKHPQVQFELYSGHADNIKERIEQGLLDVGLLQEPVDISKYDFLRTPIKEHWGILVSRDCPLARQKTVSPRDLAQVPLILPQRESVQNELSHWFGEYANRIQMVANGNLQYNMAILARNHLGCVITIRLDCRFDGLEFVPLSPKLETGTVLVWKKVQVFSPAATAFLEEAKEYLSGMKENVN